MLSKKAVIALLGAGAAGLFLAACGAKAADTGAPQPAGTSPASGSTTTTPGATSAPTSTAATASCQSSQLQVAQAKGGAAAGTIYLSFAITDTSTTPCVLEGYPVVSLVPVSGSVSPAFAHSGQAEIFSVAPAPVTLDPGSSPAAAFVVSYTDVPSGSETSCPQMSGIEVTLPGTDTADQTTESFEPCGAPDIGVSAVVSYSQYEDQFESAH